MPRNLRNFAAMALLLTAMLGPHAAQAQKSGGILRIPHLDSPASMSVHEESTIATLAPMMGVFNNLVMFDQHVKQNSLQSIVPDLASTWSWNEEGTALTLPLRQGVKWHDGRPLTSSAPGNCSAVSQPTSCASIPANPGTKTSSRSRRTAITRSPFT